MIRFLAGEKGQGKTKQLIEMANNIAKTTDADLVFIEHGRHSIYDLHYKVRLVETGSYPLSNYREMVGFLCGVISQNNDIKEIFIDGLNKIIKTINNEDLLKLLPKLEKLSAENDVEFIVSINYKVEDLPDEIRALLI